MRETLSSLPLFAGLSTQSLQLLAQHLELSTVPTGHVIVREGEPGRHLFLVDHGSVRIWKAGPTGARTLVTLQEGAFFGEMGLLDRESRSANVEAAAETRLVILPYVAFEILADLLPLDYARWLENLARTLVQRLRQLDDRFASAS